MIKFNCLIHKETGTVIKYEEWNESRRDYLRIGEKKFNPRDVLFSDDFEIIYDSEFTIKELNILIDGLETAIDEDTGRRELGKYYDLKKILYKKINTELRGKE